MSLLDFLPGEAEADVERMNRRVEAALFREQDRAVQPPGYEDGERPGGVGGGFVETHHA